jgi:hypothetical protein
MIQVLLTYKILGVTRAQVLRKFLMVKCISCCKIGTATAQHLALLLLAPLNRDVVIHPVPRIEISARSAAPRRQSLII